MSNRRRATSPSPSPSPSGSPSPSTSPNARDSLSPSPPRRRSREVRISADKTTGGRGATAKLSASRTRRPTPAVRRRSKGGHLSEVLPHDHEHGHEHVDERNQRRHNHHHHDHHHRNDESASDEDTNADDRKESSRRQVSVSTESAPNGRGGRTRQVTLASHGSGSGSRTALYDSPLSWYERMMPECLLNMTAPITGYERELARHGELDDYANEILEGERVRRNRSIRRRLAIALLAAGAASAFFIYRGRMPGRRPPGVRGAITAMTSRLEDGLSKTIQDTMGK